MNWIKGLIVVFTILFSESVSWTQENKPEQSTTITVDFKDAELSNVLRLLSDQYGINIIAGDDVKGTVTVRLKDVSLEGALNSILNANGYGYFKEGNIYRVAALDQLAADQESKKKLQDYEDLMTEVIELRYLDGQDAKKVLNGMLSPRGKIVVLERKTVPGWQIGGGGVGGTTGSTASSGSYSAAGGGSAAGLVSERIRPQQDEYERSRVLLITDTPTKIKDIFTALKKLDTIPHQIHIDAMVVEMTLENADNLGINWQSLAGWKISIKPTQNITNSFEQTKSSSSLNDLKNGLVKTETGVRNINNLSGQVTSDATEIKSVGSTDSSSSTESGKDKTSIFKDLRTAVISSEDLNLVLSALSTRGDVDVISNPNIMTLDNHEATILVGEQFPIFSTSVSDQGTVTESFQYYQPVGISLKVIPQVSANKNINMLVHPTVSEIGDFVTGTTGLKYPRIKIREADTQVLVQQGQTIVIGGLVTGRDEETINRVPFLGDLPIIGAAFRHKAIERKKVNLIVFVTPTLVRPDELSKQNDEIYKNFVDLKKVDLKEKNRKPRKFFDPPYRSSK